MTTEQIEAVKLDNRHLREFILNGSSFQVTNVQDIGAMAARIEDAIEKEGRTCRVYTEYRTAALAGEALLGGLGVIAAAGIAIHNLATFNPDFEIGKNKVTSRVTVTYKR